MLCSSLQQQLSHANTRAGLFSASRLSSGAELPELMALDRQGSQRSAAGESPLSGRSGPVQL
jgi:hypothetical protein